jgi:hypothetical protein
VTFGRSGEESGSSFITASDVRDRFNATERENDTNELDPGDRETRMRRFQFGELSGAAR